MFNYEEKNLFFEQNKVFCCGLNIIIKKYMYINVIHINK